jgi:predicted signal transduction protein with EAL and GGDEF domain
VGGDEFVLVFEDVATIKSAEVLAQKVLSILHKAIPLKHHQANVSASIGVCLYPQDGDTADALLRNADSAMYRAKSAGRGTYCFYTQDLTTNVQERVKLEGELRQAIKNNEFILHYQPQLNLSTGKLEGLEALVRWLHPEHGLIGPDKFIPFAEESDLINAIGEWVLNTATAQAKAWLDANIEFGRVAVNLSVKQIHKGNLVTLVETALANSGLPAQRLALELTETSLMEDGDASLSTLDSLKRMGIELAIDDFGTGYSSLSYLKNLPIQKLKVDRSFIQGIPMDKDDMVICKTVIALGDSLNFKIIAEGVETEAQTEFLKQVGCHEAQGFLYSKPIPAEEFEALYLTKH